MKAEDTIDMAAFLANLSTEAGRLGDVATRLDALLGEIAAADGPISTACLAQLQEMDHLRQALGALRTLAHNAAEGAKSDGSVRLKKGDLARGVTLESVRLACLNGPTSAASARPDREGVHPAVFF